MTAALILLVAAHAFDYLTFLVMTARHGLAAELNPIVVRVSEEFGVPGLTVAKAISVLFLAGVVILLSPQRRRAAIVVVVIGISLGVVGGVSNIATI